MRWPKRDLWKVGIALTGILLLLGLMVWVPVSAASTYERVSGLATPGTGTVQATPTEDATVTALNKEKLAQEVQQLKNQSELGPLDWLRTNASILFSTLAVVFGGLFGLWRWRVDRRDAQDKDLEDRRAERERRDEERFQSVVTGLGDEKEGAKIGAAILLRTFLRPGYEQFHAQTFDLAVANLRLPRTPDPLEDPDTLPPLTPLSQALIAVFKEALPLARSQNKGNPESLDATGIQLDNAYLRGADLKQAWMPHASMRKVDLSHADLSEVKLREADLREADFFRANLSGAKLSQANLSGASLDEADLTEANLWSANLSGAKLREADLSGAQLSKADLWGANLEDALTLKGTKLYGVKGLTKEQLTTCKAKGAIIDEDSTTSSSQSTGSTHPASQSDDMQAQSVPSPQGSTSTPDAGGSDAPGTES